MAPIKPRSVSGRVAPKPVSRKRVANREHSQDFESDDDMVDDGPVANTNGSVHNVSDLQDIADRVGKEVDTFAETLDQFNSKLHTEETQREAALRLCTGYKDYALDEVKRLKKEQRAQKTQYMHDTFTEPPQHSFLGGRPTRSEDASASTHDATLRQWQSEADTWDLVSAMLKARFPSQREVDARKSTLDELGPDHEYFPPEDRWQRFVLHDDAAREKHLILKWLEDTAERGVDSDKAAGSKATWTDGWTETRERIKGAKRMRIGQQEQLNVRSLDDASPLVSSLDPDGPSRSNRAIAKGDAAAERDMWNYCFEMLRRGKPWADVSKWCSERNQGWKAISMGASSEADLSLNLAGATSGALWRRLCLIAARSSAAGEFEAAVYGLLSGDLDSVLKVSRTWHDVVFAHVNSWVIASFDLHSTRLRPIQLPLDFVRRHGLEKQSTPLHSARDLIQSLEKRPSLAKEAQSAMILLQGSLIANTFQNLALEIGTTIADAAWREGPSAVIKPVRSSSTKLTLAAASIRDDPDALRVATHILIVLRALERSTFHDGGADEFDNVIAGYIQLLRTAGKRDMTPLYASLMAPHRCVASLASVIADDQDANDSMALLKIMGIYHIDTMAVIKGVYEFQLAKVLATNAVSERPLSLLEKTSDELYPGVRIRLSGARTELTADEDALVSSLEIFYLLEGHWKFTFDALTSVCGQLLGNGHFSAVAALCEVVQFEQLSLSKSGAIIGRAMNVMNPEQCAQVAENDDKTYQLQLMQQEAQAFYDVTLVVRAVSALETWRQVEHEYATKTPKPSSVPAKVRKALEEVSVAVEALLLGVLVDAGDETQAALCAKIRAMYLPEVIVAYITTLTTAGHMISRDELLTAMDLATVIANNEDIGLRQAFADAGRMTELVTVFAEVSKVMLKLNEVGAPKRARKEKGGRSLGIWEIYG